MDLQQIETVLQADGLVTSFEPASAEAPLDQLFVLLEMEEEEVQLRLELAFIPDPDEELEHTRLLQFFVDLEIDVDEADADDTRRAVLDINLALPLVGFGVHEEERYLYFRHVLALPTGGGPAVEAMVGETVWLVYYLVNQAYPALAGAARKEDA